MSGNQTFAPIADWPKIDGEYKCVQGKCGSIDIRRDPNDPKHWGCNGCGINTWSLSIYFKLVNKTPS